MGWQQIDTPRLPPSITVFRSTAALPGGAPIRAFYAQIDLDDPNLEIDVTYVGNNGTRITPIDEILASSEPVYVATNGGFFGSTVSVVPIIDDGDILAFGQQGIDRAGVTYYPTWGAWGVDDAGDHEVVWAWGSPANNAVYAYEEPYPNSLLEVPLPVPTLTPPFPSAPDGRAIPAGRLWDAVEAMGGTPVLIKNGVLLDLDETTTANCATDPNITICNELVNDPGLTGVNPRTAIGVTADRKKVILLVVDGRSSESRGTTIRETGEIMLALGAYDALNLDGGGSSTIIANDFDGVLAAPSSGNGGNSADVLNTPSDGSMRPVAMSLLIKRRPRFYDAALGPNYAETGTWTPTSNPGSYPDDASASRLAATVGTGNATTAEAVFTLNGLAPAEYEVSAWWVGGSNRATNTPFSVERQGFTPIVVRRDQTTGSSQFNPLGTYHLSSADTIRITNDADGGFAVADALRLRRVAESVPAIELSRGSNVNAVTGDRVESTVTVTSPNSGVRPTQLTVYQAVDGGAETVFDQATFSGTSVDATYALAYTVTEPADSTVTFRFEAEDNLGHVVSETLTISVLEINVQFDPPVLPLAQPAGRAFEFDVNLASGDPAKALTTLEILVSVNGGPPQRVRIVSLTGTSTTVPFRYLVDSEAGDDLVFTFVVTAADGTTTEATYSATVEPARGDFVLGFVSDMNGSFGATSYDASIRNSFDFFVEQGVDAVLSGGDMVAGQCSSATACDEDAMWAGFDAELYSQLKNASIPFLFTLQNHDAANSWDIEAALRFWQNPANVPAGPGVTFVDDTDYPRNYSVVLDFDNDGQGDVFFVSVFNPGDDLNATEIAFLDGTLATSEAQSARFRVVAAGQPLYAVSAPRNTPGFLTGPRDPITAILRDRNVNFYMSGDSAAYYPGKRFEIQLLSLAEMAGTGKAYIGESQVPPSAITRADIFIDDPYYGRDAIVFTTYDTRDDFRIVRKETLPTALFGFDGDFVIRDDVPVTNSGRTRLSSKNVLAPFDASATGSATFEIRNGRIDIQGQFSNLDTPLLTTFDAVALYRGRNGQAGTIIDVVTVNTVDGRTGTFWASLPETTETKDGLAVGLYYLEFLTVGRPDGALRGHFFNDETSSAPTAPSFVGEPGQTVEVRDLPALLDVAWAPAEDAEKSPITYIYELSETPDFRTKLISESVGRETVFRGRTQAEWLTFLGGQPSRTMYQRLIVSDGQNVVTGPAFEFVLAEATGPIQGQVTIPTPNYEFQGVFATLGAGFRVYDIAIDEQTGRVWACTLSHGPYVYNADGTPYRLSDPAIGYGVDEFGNEFVNSFAFNGASFNDGTCYGVEYDPSGYVYLAVDQDVFKLDAFTGRPVAYWDSASGFGFETNPSLANDGSLFGHDVFPGNRGFIIRPSLIDPSSFDIVREFNGANPPQLLVSGGVSRSSAFSPEGDRIYLPPTASSPNVAIYSTANGTDWTREPDYVMPAPTGSDAIYAGPNQQMWVINEKSAFPPNLIYVDFAQQFTWNLFLEDIDESDLRAFTVSRDGRTFYVGGGQAIYKYQLAGGSNQGPVQIALAQATAINAAGDALRAGQRVQVTAVVTTTNFSGTGLEFYGEDANDEVKFFSAQNSTGYQPTVGDSIRVTGLVEQSLGQVQIIVEAISVVSTGQALRGRPLVTAIGEAEESKVVMLSGLALANVADWRRSGFAGFDVEATGNHCGVDNEPSVSMFIDRDIALFTKRAPRGCFTAIGVVQQRGSGYVLTPIDEHAIALEGSVDARLLRRFLPGTGDLAVFRARAHGLPHWKHKTYRWYRNGFEVTRRHRWQSYGGRTFRSRSLQAGDLIFATAELPRSPYPYISPIIELGLGPNLVADTTDNAPGETIEITFAPNPDWAAQVVEVDVNHTCIPSERFTVESDRIVFEPGVFPAEGDYRVVVRATGYKRVRVTQTILTGAPEVVADSADNDLLNDIEITFADDPAWRASVTAVVVNGVTLDPSDYTLEAGRLVIRAGLFPGVGVQTVSIVAAGYTTRTFEQTIVLSSPPVLAADITDNEVGRPIDITFAPNATWQDFITSVQVNGFDLLASEYSVTDGILTLQTTAVPQIREYVITVKATNFSDATVNQPILARRAPALVADAVDNDIFNPITIQFADDPAWRASVLAVLVNGVILSPADFTLAAGQLTIASSFFPSAGDYAIAISAGLDYRIASVVQTVTAPVYTVSGIVRQTGGAPLSGVDVFLDERLQMRFDGTLDDTSGNAAAPVQNSPPMTFVNDAERGQVLDFNGTNDAVNITAFRLPGDYTVNLWLNPDLVAGVQGGWSRSFLAYYADADNAFRFALDTSILRASVITDGQVVGRETPSTFALTANDWVQVTVVVVRGRSATLYVDGVDAGSVPNAWSRGTDPGLTLGARAVGQGHFDGQFDDLTIWNRALTPAEVATLVTTGEGPGVVTDTAGAYSTTVGYDQDLILKPVLAGLTFTPANAVFTAVRSDQTQDFDGSGNVGLSIVNPIPDAVVTSSASYTLNVSAVMSDPASPSTAVVYSVGTVTAPTFVTVTISQSTLTAAFNEFYGRSTIDVVGTANGRTATDVFTLELDPYCAAQGGGNWEHIIDVDLTGPNNATLIDNESGRTFYSNFRHDAAPGVSRGQTLTLRVAGQDWPSDEVRAWFDWNRDGDFADAGEEYLVGTGRGPEVVGTNLGAWSTQIVVPSSAAAGPTVLRIRHEDADSGANPNGTPCGNAGFGEIEDYSITVQP